MTTGNMAPFHEGIVMLLNEILRKWHHPSL
jgi:hypothetical protein